MKYLTIAILSVVLGVCAIGYLFQILLTLPLQILFSGAAPVSSG